MKNKDRVKDKRYFNLVIHEGVCLKNKYFIIYIRKSENENPRFGIAVGKKIGTAVERNKTKRRIRNILRDNINSIPEYNDYIIVTKKSCKEEKYDTLYNELINLLRKGE